MKFGDNLRTIRKSKKISQEDLAEKVGVSRQSVSKWECAEAYPEMDNILKLCKVFHCKINDLVTSDTIDIDSLDENVKMSIVKLGKEKQRKMKGLSKTLYILARIGQIALILGVFSVILTMLITPYITSNIKVKENRIEIFDQEITYQNEKGTLTLTSPNKTWEIKNTEDKNSLIRLEEMLKNHSMTTLTIFIELAFSFLIATLILLYFTMKHLEKLFRNIHNGETPFTMENVGHIKRIATLMIISILLPLFGGALGQIGLGEDLGIGIELLDFIYILFLFSMAYIFEYGYEIQRDSKGKMYGDEYE